MKLEDKLTELRKKSGLTQEQVSDAMEVSRQTVSKWEMGGAVPASENLIRLSRLYNVPLEYLVKDDATLPESREEKQDPPPAKSRRGVIALLLAILVILTMAMALGHFSQKGGDTEEIIPVGKLQEEEIVVSPESEFEFTWGE